jgi:two-component system sensor histidine kinase BaeS
LSHDAAATDISLSAVGWRTAGRLLLAVGAALALALWLALVVLNAPQQDFQLLALILAGSSLASLVAGFAGARLGWRLPWGGLQLKIALAVAVGILVALVNVAATAFLMFLSPHDLGLLSLLLVFALAVSLAFGFSLAEMLTGRVRMLTAGARRLASGDLSVRVEVPAGDEVGELAQAFNVMAERMELATRRQRELEAARRDLIFAISHDLRSPLTSLQAMVEALHDGVVGDEETTQRYLRTMRADIRHLRTLIDDLFELNQLDAGVLRLQRETSRLPDLISDTIESVQAQAQARGLRVSGEVDPTLAPVLIDPARIQRVLTNLVRNAIRHTPAGGTITLTARETGDSVQVSVVDSGEGIAPEEQQQIFERFYRGDPARSRDGGGAGLGLTIARGLVEAHGGRIWVDSAPGRGAAFHFTLPKAASARAGDMAVPAP